MMDKLHYKISLIITEIKLNNFITKFDTCVSNLKNDK